MNIRRRTLLLVATTWPLVAFAQQPNKISRIGFLSSASSARPQEQAFRQRLGELGYVDGRNAVIEWRYIGGMQERSAGFANELVRLKVDCIVAVGVSTIRASIEATNTIPIVMATIDADPVELGFIKSLARPGGNVTGFTGIAYDLAGKRLELLKEVAPRTRRAVVLIDSRGSGDAQRAHLKSIEAASKKLGVELQVLAVSGPEELHGAALKAARDGRTEAISVVSTGWMNSHRSAVIDFAAKLRLPAVYTNAVWPPEGGLMSYGYLPEHQFREVAGYVARILGGAKPADLPVQQPTKFELAVNLKTAKALGITMPQTILVRADRVIE